MIKSKFLLLSLCETVTLLAGSSGSTNAFVPVCGGHPGQFVYSSPTLQVLVDGRDIVLHSGGDTMRLSYSGAEAVAQGARPVAGQVNVFKETSSCRGLPMFGEVSYSGLYPGVSLRLEFQNSVLKSEFSVEPGGEPSRIRIRYSGAPASIDDAGNLVLGKWIERRPVAWQIGPNGAQTIPVAWRLSPGGTVGFTVGKYNHSLKLTIDPALSYSTYLANATNSAHSAATAVALDSSGNSYVGGWIESNGLPTPLVGQAGSQGSVDGFLIKCSPAGVILFATYFGGSGYDQILGVAVDGLSRVWVTGVTSSVNLPLTNPFQSALAGYQNAFVATFSSTGSLLFSTFFGGAGPDAGNGIVADAGGNAYIVGDTQSSNFPIRQAAQSQFGGTQDAFVAKFNSQGALVYSTFVGGSDADHGAAIAVDSGGAAYISGGTFSRNFPTHWPFQAALHGVGDAFVTKLDSTGANLVYSTYLGGSSGTALMPERANAIAVDSQGNAYVAGVTSSADFPAPVASPSPVLRGDSDAFLAELNAAGNALVFSTFIGGIGEETATALALAPSGALSVVGYTSSQDFPAVAQLQTSLTGIWNAFVTVVNPGGAGFSFSTVLGGSGIDAANGVAVDSAGTITVVGQAGSADFPLANSQSETHFGGFDAFATKIRMSASAAGSQSTVTYDFTGNGSQDLAVYFASSPGYEYSLLSNGTGSYSSQTTGSINVGAVTFDTFLQADFNGDSKSDLLFYSSATGTLKVGVGTGTGTFTYAPVITIGAGYNVIARGDFNRDGKTDLLFYRKSDGAASVALSNGDGTFSFIVQTFSPGFSSVVVGDFNGDGISDVVVYNNATSPYVAYLLFGDGAGHLVNGIGLFFGGGFTLFSADLNSDGKTDLVLYRPADGTVLIALSSGTGFSYHYQLYSPNFTAFKIGDVNGDGHPDFVLYNAANAIGYLLLGDGAGNFSFSSSLFFGPGMDFVDLRDLNGDGKQDVILYRTADGTSFTGISNGTGFTYTYNYFGPGRLIAQ